jgi:hypothetical protein
MLSGQSLHQPPFQKEKIMLTRVLLVNLDTGEQRLLKNWFYRTKYRLHSLGTADRQEAAKRAAPMDRLLRAVFNHEEEPFTDEAQLSHQNVAQGVHHDDVREEST